jgi:hypothetical protein
MGKSDRQRDIAFQIGASKAIRNVICNALQTYADYALEQAQQSIVERFARDLPGSRTKAAERTKERGWDIKRVERVIGKVVGEWLAPDLAKVSAMFKAVDDGMISVAQCSGRRQPTRAAVRRGTACCRKATRSPDFDRCRAQRSWRYTGGPS